MHYLTLVSKQLHVVSALRNMNAGKRRKFGSFGNPGHLDKRQRKHLQQFGELHPAEERLGVFQRIIQKGPQQIRSRSNWGIWKRGKLLPGGS